MIKMQQQFQFFKEVFSPVRISIFFGFAVLLIVSIVFLKEQEQRPSKISSLFAEYELFKSSVCEKDNFNESKCGDKFCKIPELCPGLDECISKEVSKHIKAAESLINQSPSESVINDSKIDAECVEEFFKIKYEPFKSSVCTKDNLDEIKCVEEFFKVTELDTELDKLFKQMETKLETKRQEISNIISRLL